MFRVSELKIDQYRNVEPTHLKFSPGINVFLGKNGTGKTALLKLLEQIVTDDFSATEDEVSYHTTLKPDAEADDPIEISFEAALGSPPADSPPEVRAAAQVKSRLQAKTKTGRLDWNGAAGALKAEMTDADGSRFPVAPHPRRALQLQRMTNSEPTLGLMWVTAASSAPGRLDEGLDVFRALTDMERPAVEFLEVPGGDTESRVRIATQLHRRQVVPAVWAALDASDENGDLGWTNEQDDVLQRFIEMCGFSRATVFCRMLESERHELGNGWVERVFGGLGFFFHSRDDRRAFSHTRLSFGQKRLLALLYHASASEVGGPFLADELVNGLHYDWIASVMEAIEGRQSFLTSQNPILLDQITGLNDAEMVRQTFITCRASDDGKGLVWENIARSDAEEFVRSYSSGLAHVSEVLRDLDLW